MTKEDEAKLLTAAGRSDSPALLPLLVLAMDTGLRASETRALQQKDLELKWDSGTIVSGRLIVPKSKTEAGTGRTIPLTRRLCGVLTLWLSRFPELKPESFVVPRHRIACRGGKLEHHLYDVDLGKPLGPWKRAWKHACLQEANLSYRWHDLRHTFVSRLAENPAVSRGNDPIARGPRQQANAPALQPDQESLEGCGNRCPGRHEIDFTETRNRIGVGTKTGTTGT